jgi:nucleotide-binding universal stress UspA family protein
MSGPVICAIEDESGAGVADVARELAERYAFPLLYVHVLDGDGEMEQAVRMLRNAAPGSGELAIERAHHPADRLVELAEQRGASFLVVGNHGPHASVLGSISADVSRRAPCPVVVVSPAAEAEAPGREARSDEPDVRGGIVRFRVGSTVRQVA